MPKAFGIINSSGRHLWVEGLQEYRPISAFSFLGRYRVIDFPISNMSNSGIDQVQIYIRRSPRSLVEHVGTGRHYNINSKRGKLQLLFSEDGSEHSVYNTDVAMYLENLECLEEMPQKYVVIAPSYMVYSQNYDTLLRTHIESGADITMLYHSVDNANDYFLACNAVNLNRQKGVLSIERNRGNAKNRNISMDTYVMSKELLLKLIHIAKSMSSIFTLADIINVACREYDVRGVSHRGYFSSITDFKSYYASNMSLIDIKTAFNLFDEEWPIYTRTNDSCPTQYFETANIKNSVISNGCLIEGTIENSVIGRGCVIKKGAVIRNSVILPSAVIGEDVHVENYVIDKHARITHTQEIIADPEHPGYIRRSDLI